MKPKQLTFVLIGTIALFAIGGLIAFWFSHQALNAKSDELSEVLADISLVNEQLTSYQRLEREYAEIAPLQASADRVLPNEKRQAEVALQLQSIVRSVGLELRGLTFESTAGQPGAQSQTLAADVSGVLMMPVRFQISSDYADFIEFLRRIENQQRYMQVSNLSISRSDGNNLQFNINLEVFLQP